MLVSLMFGLGLLIELEIKFNWNFRIFGLNFLEEIWELIT